MKKKVSEIAGTEITENENGTISLKHIPGSDIVTHEDGSFEVFHTSGNRIVVDADGVPTIYDKDGKILYFNELGGSVKMSSKGEIEFEGNNSK